MVGSYQFPQIFMCMNLFLLSFFGLVSSCLERIDLCFRTLHSISEKNTNKIQVHPFLSSSTLHFVFLFYCFLFYTFEFWLGLCTLLRSTPLKKQHMHSARRNAAARGAEESCHGTIAICYVFVASLWSVVLCYLSL